MLAQLFNSPAFNDVMQHGLQVMQAHPQQLAQLMQLANGMTHNFAQTHPEMMQQAENALAGNGFAAALNDGGGGGGGGEDA